MVILRRWSVSWRENGYVTEVVNLMEGEWSCYRSGHVNELEKGHVIEVASLKEGE